MRRQQGLVIQHKLLVVIQDLHLPRQRAERIVRQGFDVGREDLARVAGEASVHACLEEKVAETREVRLV